MNNYFLNRYPVLKPKDQKKYNDFSYLTQLQIQVGQIVRLSNFEEETGLDLDLIINIKIDEGMVGISKIDDEYYVLFAINTIDMPRKDLRPNKIVASYIDKNSNIQTKEFVNDVDCVLWYNNSLQIPETFLNFFANELTEIDTSISLNVLNARYNHCLKVHSQKQKTQFEDAVNASKDGRPIVYVDDTLDGFPFTSDDTFLNFNDVNKIEKVQYLSQLHDDYLKRFSNMYGVSMNMSAKKAQQTEKEISGMDAMSWLIPLDMLHQAKKFCERFKKLYDVEISAHFGMVHELNFQKYANDCTADDNLNDDYDNNKEPGESEVDADATE